ncbi:Maf family protein [Acinetobacter populi]|uniref:Nucleoside triphosphate pyrophosphatase n=1 Tax=Acinetobacter populi TaxID=1582270 RepID=A0A1Z9Z1A2_9GAMM|nr:nucleoside triphosphate pyrophosphatase [Acinetobacter populi]OUY08226.1 septum formation protein Maf [Acinetobacter populi]
MAQQIILASSSVTRKALMDRLNLNYLTISPDIDECAQAGETAQQLAYRLSIEKASVIATQYPDAIVISSDQVAWLAESPTELIGKPYTEQAAIQQLQRQSGKVLNFSTGVSVQCLAKNYRQTSVIPFQVKFRRLSNHEIQRYIQFDQPLHCAGSFKCESLGMTLFESMYGDDYTALMGLPLIQLCQYLRELEVPLP